MRRTIEASLPRALAAELLGTFIFVTIGAGSVVVTNAGFAPLGVLGVVAAHGLALAVVVASFGAVSGGHFNPAVTVSVWLGGRMRISDAFAYMGAQIAGAVAAGGILLAMLGRTADQLLLGTPGPRAGLGVGRAVLVEVVFTLFVVITHWALMVDERNRVAGGFGVGLIFFASMLIAAQVSGGALNPVRHFGPALVSGSFRSWWVYWVGPVTGGILAGLVYPTLFLDRRFPWRLVPARDEEPTAAPARRARRRDRER